MTHTGIQRGESSRVIAIRLLVMHLACLGVFFVPLTWPLAVGALVGYFARVFAFEVGSHRYFAHRSFRTSRAFQLFLAVLAAAAGQRGPIWWAVHHRSHHRHSDGPQDIHSPVSRSFWYAHIGWLMDQRNLDTDLDAARDLSRYPEMVWVNKYHYIFPLLVLAATYLVGQHTALFGATGHGLAALVWVFFVPTALALHAALIVNTWVHGHAPGLLHHRPFDTGDSTTNAWALAVPTMGASWHNNHHRYMNAARAGFYWWQLDLSYLVLRLLAMLRIVWDLRPVPQEVLVEGRRPLPGLQR